MIVKDECCTSTQANMTTSNSILLYRFLPADSAIKTIESRAFRVSRLLELNDPFEWRIGLNSVKPNAEELARYCLDSFIAEMNEMFGILSFSELVNNSLLWSHYADSHRGIVFEVEYLLNPGLHRVQYTNVRPAIDPKWIHDKSQEKQLLENLLASLCINLMCGSMKKSIALLLDLRSAIQPTECTASQSRPILLSA